MIDALQAESSVQQLCAVFDCPRSTYYYQPVQRDEAALLAAIEQVLMRHPWFGYRRVVAQLQREGVQVGETVVRRLLKTLGHSCSVGQVRVQTTDSHHAYTRYTNLIKGLKVKQPNQIWVAERSFAWMGAYRRLAKDFEFFTERSEGMIYLASIHRLLRRLAPAA